MKPFVLWMTGLPCSGKTTIVKNLQKDIPNLAMLDGDELREWFSPKDFSKAGRDEHNKKVAHLAKLLLKHGVPSAVSLVSPYLENRENAKHMGWVVNWGFIQQNQVLIATAASNTKSRIAFSSSLYPWQ